MQDLSQNRIKKGTLYLVSTPIGNLEDITLRAIRMLKEADFIAAEDTRHTLKLLNHFGIKNQIVSFHEHSSAEKCQKLFSALEEGKSIALVSDAGTPLISDPGAKTGQRCGRTGNRDFCRARPLRSDQRTLCFGTPVREVYFRGIFTKR